MPFTLKVQVAGADQDVTIDEAKLPESAISAIAKQHKLVPGETFNAELDRRVDGVIKNKGLRNPAELIDDQEHVTAVLKKHGQVPDAAKAAEQLAQRLEAERTGWREKELKPVVTERDALKTHNGRLIERGLHKEILSAASPIVKKQYLRAVGPSRLPYIVAALAPVFGYDPQTDDYYVKSQQGEGFVFSSDQKKYGRPYMTVAEYFESWAAEKDNAEYLERQTQSGPGMGGAGGGSDRTTEGGVIWLTPEEAGDAQVRARANEQARKTGAVVRTRMPANPYGVGS